MTPSREERARNVVVGRVAAPYGVRGWLKVVPFTATPEALLGFQPWHLAAQGGSRREFRVIAGRVHGTDVVAQVEGIATREEAALWRGAAVEVPRGALPRPGRDEVYLADLPGCEVVNAQGVALGVVQEVQDSGAHPLLRVRDGGGTERLIPLVPAFVTGVDLDAHVIEVDWQADY